MDGGALLRLAVWGAVVGVSAGVYAGAHLLEERKAKRRAKKLQQRCASPPQAPADHVMLTLDFSHKRLYDQSVRPLVKQLTKDNAVKCLILNDNFISDDGALLLAASIEQHPGLTMVSLRVCCIGERGIAALIHTLRHNQCLLFLDLEGNPGFKQEYMEPLEQLLSDVDRVASYRRGKDPIAFYFSGTPIHQPVVPAPTQQMPVLPRKALPVPPTGRGSAPGTQPTVPPEEGIAPIRAMSPTPSTPPPVPVPRPSTAKTQSADDLLIKPPAPRSPPAAYASPPPQRTPPATPPKRAPSATTPAAACAESLSSRAAPQPRHGSPVNAVATPPPMPPRPGACSPQSNSASNLRSAIVLRRPSTPILPSPLASGIAFVESPQPQPAAAEEHNARDEADDDDEVTVVEAVSLHGSFSIRKRKGTTVTVNQQEDIDAERANLERVEAQLAQYYDFNTCYAQLGSPSARAQPTDPEPSLQQGGKVQQYGRDPAVHHPVGQAYADVQGHMQTPGQPYVLPSAHLHAQPYAHTYAQLYPHLYATPYPQPYTHPYAYPHEQYRSDGANTAWFSPPPVHDASAWPHRYVPYGAPSHWQPDIAFAANASAESDTTGHNPLYRSSHAYQAYTYQPYANQWHAHQQRAHQQVTQETVTFEQFSKPHAAPLAQPAPSQLQPPSPQRPQQPTAPARPWLTAEGLGQSRAFKRSEVKGAAKSVSKDLVSLEKRAFDLTNEFRAAAKLPPLDWDDALRYLCREHSKAMGEKLCQFGHEKFAERNQQYIEKSSHFVASLYALPIAENVAYNLGFPDPAKTTVDGWIQSTGHRRNMLASHSHSAIGVYVSSGGTLYFTQLFAKLEA